MYKKISDKFVKKLSCKGVLLVIINVLLLVLGIVILITGSSIHQITKDIDDYVEIKLIENTSVVFMVIGVTLILIGLIGKL